jgi:hypothetical protein
MMSGRCVDNEVGDRTTGVTERGLRRDHHSKQAADRQSKTPTTSSAPARRRAPLSSLAATFGKLPGEQAREIAGGWAMPSPAPFIYCDVAEDDGPGGTLAFPFPASRLLPLSSSLSPLKPECVSDYNGGRARVACVQGRRRLS